MRRAKILGRAHRLCVAAIIATAHTTTAFAVTRKELRDALRHWQATTANIVLVSAKARRAFLTVIVWATTKVLSFKRRVRTNSTATVGIHVVVVAI